MSINESLLVPEEKTMTEWSQRLRRISQFSTRPNNLKLLPSRPASMISQPLADTQHFKTTPVLEVAPPSPRPSPPALAPPVERTESRRKSFSKASTYKPILKQKTLVSQLSVDKSRSPTNDKKVKFHKTKSVLKYNPDSKIGRQKSLKK